MQIAEPAPADAVRSPDGKQWWDGSKWLNAPGSTPSNPTPILPPLARRSHPHQEAAPSGWAWALAAFPLVALAIAVLVGAVGGSKVTPATCLLVGAVAVIVLNWWFAIQDRRLIARAGDPTANAGWFFWLGPLGYLFARASKRPSASGLDWGLPIASMAAWIALVAGGGAVVGAVIAAQTPLAQTATGQTGSSAITSTDLRQALTTAETVCTADWTTQTCTDRITDVQTADAAYQQALGGAATDTSAEVNLIAQARSAGDGVAASLVAEQKAFVASDTAGFTQAYQQFASALALLPG